ncbi:YolD-like family protein [Paenibacillus timonensis]|uniref:YolD-like family protein n=1 Tax=Paenibacillus timonensis TaxID=225915 RepID=UPI003F9C028A
MKSRLGAGLWESKFVLPQHKEELRRVSREERRKPRRELDIQEVELIERAIAEAFRERLRITLRIWGEFEDSELSGWVGTVQTYLREIKLTTEPGVWQWIKIEDILSASIN